MFFKNVNFSFCIETSSNINSWFCFCCRCVLYFTAWEKVVPVVSQAFYVKRKTKKQKKTKSKFMLNKLVQKIEKKKMSGSKKSGWLKSANVSKLLLRCCIQNQFGGLAGFVMTDRKCKCLENAVIFFSKISIYFQT